MVIDVPKDICFVNIGELTPAFIANNPGLKLAWRNWKNSREFGYVSAGQGRNWSKQIEKLNIDDIVIGFITQHGYVGIGKVISKAVPIKNFRMTDGKSLKDVNLYTPNNIFLNEDDAEKTEYVVGVQWLEDKTVNKEDAFWQVGIGLYAKPLIRASLKAQYATLNFLEESFKVKFEFHN